MSTLFEIRVPGRRPVRMEAANPFLALGRALPELFEETPAHLELVRGQGGRWEIPELRLVIRPVEQRQRAPVSPSQILLAS